MEDWSKEVSFGVWEEVGLDWRNDILLGGWEVEVLGLKEGATMKAGR